MKKQIESVKEFNLPFIPGVKALSGQHIHNEFRRHIHKTYIVGTVDQGERIITYPEGMSCIQEHEVFIIHPAQVHTCSSSCSSGHSYRLLSISPQTMQSIASEISKKQEERPYFLKGHYQDEALSERLECVFSVIQGPESDIEVESKIYAFLTYLIMDFSRVPPVVWNAGEQKESINRVCHYIGQHYTENLSLKELANIACLSPFHFQREFRRCVGITPHEYISDFRIKEAKNLLLKSKNMAAIAVKLGFFDQSHFTRVFKKTVGIPPGKYAKMNKL